MTRLLGITVAIFCVHAAGAFAAEPLAQRWLYYPTNLLVSENVDQLEAVWRRAAKTGYTHVNISDTKFCILDQMPEKYFKNAERVKKLAKELKLELVPGVLPIGWSNALLANDPNLAEGLPVRDALFVVHSGEARLVADPPVMLPSTADLAKWNWHDETVSQDQAAARITDPKGKNARMMKTLKVQPFRQYHISVQIKTDGYQGKPEAKVIAGERTLNYNDLGTKPTQDWTAHHTVFNSLDNEQVNVYLGSWGANKGSAWYKDVKIEEVGLLNALRRPGAPLVLMIDGKDTPLIEGKDFESVADSRLGNQPYNGEYEVWHQPPTIKTRLPDGTRLRVSYYHPMIIYGGSVMIALSEPKTMELLADHARGVQNLFAADAYFMMHDEIRILNWDQASTDRGLDAGQVLAENVRGCTKIIRDLNPNARLFIWSDMFDPHHNAHKNYYLVRGDLTGSWEGLDPSVTIVNWNFDKRDESLKFFADRGHKQLIAGYYDGGTDSTKAWLASAKKAPSVQGIMYTTWESNYSQIEAFQALVDCAVMP